ncbi:MAG: PAS domain-containing protein [Sphingomonas sp.]
MDRLGSLSDGWGEIDEDGEADMADLSVDDNQTIDIGTDERRMQVRAYNYWVSLLDGRAYPAIADLNPENIADFGPHSVLLDFTDGIEDPSIRYLGSVLREECGMVGEDVRISQVPGRSLLSRLTDHYLQIIANRAPIGFEAEFTGTRGHNTLYRGILMPFSSDGEQIDFIYGVINWKELVDAATQAMLEAQVAEAVKAAPSRAAPAAIWADGPSASFDEPETPAERSVDADMIDFGDMSGVLADQLMLAQQSAAACRAADVRSRAALYRALGRAYDFAIAAAADADGYAALLERAGLKAQERAPMTPIVKLVFGTDYDKTRVTEFATVLDQARRDAVAPGMLTDYLDAMPGGIKGVVAAARAARRVAERAQPFDRVRAELFARAPMARVAVETGVAAGELVVLLGRASADGSVDIVAHVADPALTERAARRAAA